MKWKILNDFVGGTSTGGALAVAIGAKKKSLEFCRTLYYSLSSKVFIQSENEASWFGTFPRMTNSINLITVISNWFILLLYLFFRIGDIIIQKHLKNFFRKNLEMNI